ncbi:MAG TPA: hypothetical protein VN780_07855 [Candidatus Eisenbacteria bacterium]|jgi:hypothetical protein|nr:hypothetical protein [Candidatus Eisenbacteria bacterium]
MGREFAVAASVLLFTAMPIGAASARTPSWQDASQPSSQAQSPASAPAATPAPSSSSTSSTKPKPKKTWTNDNVSDASGTISVVGSANSATPSGKGSKVSPKPAATIESIDPKVVASLRDQLHRLQGQLNIVNKQYSDLKAQSKGEAKSAGGLQANTFNYDSSSVEEQLRRLQEKKKRLEDAIDQLLDAARKAGIEPGDLR